jgi:hypothetical protein
MGEYTEIYVELLKNPRKFLIKNRGIFLRGENPPNCQTTLPSRPLKSEEQKDKGREVWGKH